MTAVPAWARAEKPSLEAAATEKLEADAAATRLHLGGVGSLPLDRESARFELTAEERANRGTRPRTRRWKALDKLDAEVDRLTQKQVDASARVQDAEQAFTDAPQVDARTLADWISAGERGERPAATLPERVRELAAARLLVEAVVLEIDRALERRLEHVARHRARMLGDARADIDKAHRQLLGKVSELPALRQQLADARETLLWAASFPDPVTQFGLADHVALGLMAPVERTLSTRARIAYVNLIAVLEEDAAALAGAFSTEQREALGEPAARSPLISAMWDADPDNVAWKKRELERARQLAEYHPHIDQVASEARDLRA